MWGEAEVLKRRAEQELAWVRTERQRHTLFAPGQEGVELMCGIDARALDPPQQAELSAESHVD